MQEEDAVRVANCALSFCASSAFCSWKSDEDAVLVAVEAALVVVADSSSELEQSSVLVAEAASVLVAVASVLVDSDAAEVVVAVLLEDEEPEMFWRPGSCVMSVSCVPSAIGPLGLAGHEPSGLRASVWPKGMVPVVPRARPPTNVFWSAPWNWHWKRPFSSEFFGAVWQ